MLGGTSSPRCYTSKQHLKVGFLVIRFPISRGRPLGKEVSNSSYLSANVLAHIRESVLENKSLNSRSSRLPAYS